MFPELTRSHRTGASTQPFQHPVVAVPLWSGDSTWPRVHLRSFSNRPSTNPGSPTGKARDKETPDESAARLLKSVGGVAQLHTRGSAAARRPSRSTCPVFPAEVLHRRMFSLRA